MHSWKHGAQKVVLYLIKSVNEAEIRFASQL